MPARLRDCRRSLPEVWLLQPAPGLHQRTPDRMPAAAVVDVPAQIAVSFHDVGVLDEDHRTVESVVAHPHVGASQSSETQQARVVR